MIDFKKETICDHVHFNSIHDDRFKTGRISATVFLPLSEDTASKNAILPFMLKNRCKQYPNLIEMNKRLSELYGATIHATVFKLGEAQAFTLSASGIDGRYTFYKEDVCLELSKLLRDILFDPVLDENGIFLQKDFLQEKRQLIDLIESEYNDKRAFAKLRCEELMCKNERFGISRFGSLEQVKQMTPEDATAAWKNALHNARIEFLQLGDADSSLSYDVLKDAFSKIKRGPVEECQTELIKKADGIHEYNDTMDVSQCKLVLGLRTGVAEPDEQVMAMRLFAALYGGTPHSKLFLNVREKMSLCYYCSARYDRNKGILLVQSGVEKQNIDKARQEILNQLKLLQNGAFTKEELDATKLSVENSFRTTADYLGGLENFYLTQMFDRTILTPEELAKAVGKVTREQVIDAAKRVTLDTIYTLRSSEEGTK